MSLDRVLVLGLFVAAIVPVLANTQSFDRLDEPARQSLKQRFEKEVWPLMVRDGKNGCVGCHSSGKGGTALRLRGDPDKDFAYLVKEGFFIPNDAGSLLGRIGDGDAFCSWLRAAPRSLTALARWPA